MEWRVPTNETEIQAFNEGLEIERYREGRDTPAPYIAPPPAPEQVAPQPFPHRKVAIAVGYVAGSAVVVTGVVAVCKAVVTGIAAFAAANAATIGGVAVAGFVVALVASGLAKGEHGANKTHSGPPPNEDEGWEFYQEQRQGWRKKSSI